MALLTNKIFNNLADLIGDCKIKTTVEIINEAKSKLEFKYEPEVNAIATYLALVLI